MNRKIILYSDDFMPKEEFVDVLSSFGYTNHKSLECRTDDRVINFVENNSSNWFNTTIYKGKNTSERLSGFTGFAYIEAVEINRKFHIIYSRNKFQFVSCSEIIKYKDEYNYNWQILKG